MEAAAISNAQIASPPGLPVGALPYTGNQTSAAAPAHSDDSGASGKQGSAFAQVIQEMLVRTVGENAAAPIRPLSSGGSGNVKNGNSAPAKSSQKNAVGDASSSLPNILVAGLDAAVVTLPPSSVEAPEQTSGPDAEAAPVVVTRSSNNQSTATANGIAEVSAGLEEFAIAIPADESTEYGSQWPSQSPTKQTAAGAPVDSDSPTQVAGPATPTVAPPAVEVAAAAKVNGVVVSPEKTKVPQISIGTIAENQGVPVSAAVKQIEQLQSPNTTSTLSISSRNVSQPQVLPHTAVQPANGVQPANLSSLEARSITPLASSTPAKQFSAAGDSGNSEAPVPAVSEGNHFGTKNNSSNESGEPSAGSDESKGAPTPGSAATTPGQSLAAANTAKPEIAPTTAAAAPVAPVTTATAPTSSAPTPVPMERAANPSVPQNAAAPAPSPNANLTSTDPTAIHTTNDAQLMQTATHSEMRIAMQTDKFGAIELHARVAGDEIGAAITVEKRDAHAALAMELPALQQALSDKQLRVDQVALLHGSLSSTAGEAGAHAQQGERGSAQRGVLQNFAGSAENLAGGELITAEQLGVFNAQGRLSVLA